MKEAYEVYLDSKERYEVIHFVCLISILSIYLYYTSSISKILNLIYILNLGPINRFYALKLNLNNFNSLFFPK